MTIPTCAVTAQPPLVKPGQTVKVHWRATNTASATMLPALGPIVGEAGILLDTPTRTTIYTMTATGADGTQVTARGAVAVPERTEPLQWPPAPFAHMPADYLARALTALRLCITNTKLESDQRWIQYATASLLFEQDAEVINDFFANYWEAPDHDSFGFSLFSMDAVRLYGLYNSLGTFPNRLTLETQKNMLEQLFLVAADMDMTEYEVDDIAVVWKMRGSENHTLAAESSYFLVAQFLKNNPEFADRPYADGMTPTQHYEIWRRFMSRMLDERAKRGLFIEVGSPSYEAESRQAILNIRDFSEDPAIRKKAEMVLDLSYAVAAQESLNAVRGGAKSRVYTDKDTFWGVASDRNYDIALGPTGYRQIINPIQPTSSYLPPPAILNLSKDIIGRGSYTSIHRVPGVGERAKDSVLSMDNSIYRYSFSTPSYVMGSFVLDPAETYIAPSAQNRWQGIVFDGDARIAPRVTRLKLDGTLDNEQRTANGFYALQDRNVLIMQRRADTTVNARTELYFASSLDIVQEEDGWLFVQEKDTFVAVKIVGTYSWLDPVTKNQNMDPGKNFIALDYSQDPMIIIANQASDYGNNFENFKAILKTQPISYDGTTLRFSTMTFYSNQIGKRNDVTINIAQSKVYNSPFIRSNFGSGLVRIRKGDDAVTLDFRDQNNPLKTVINGSITLGPEGIGTTKPLIFLSR